MSSGRLVPAVPSCILDPLREEFLALLPPRIDDHPLGCHRRRIPDSVVFDKLVEVWSTGPATSGSPMCPARRPPCAGAATSGLGWACGIGCGRPAWTPTTR